VVAGWVRELLKNGGLAVSTSAQYARHFRQFTKWYEVMGKGIMEDRGMQFVDEDLWLMWLALEMSSIFYYRKNGVRNQTSLHYVVWF
jgi:hypothetical protein